MAKAWSSSVKLPVPTTFGQRNRFGEVCEKAPTGDVFGAEGQNVGGGLLTVYEMKSPGLQLPDQRD